MVHCSHCQVDWLQLLSSPIRIFKSRYCSQIKVSILDKLTQACPLIEEVDLSVDINSLAACKVSILHASYEPYPSRQSSNWVLLHKMISYNLTRLSLKGRADIQDSDLMTIVALFHSISVLNIDGCTFLTDQAHFVICHCGTQRLATNLFMLSRELHSRSSMSARHWCLEQNYAIL